MKCHRCDEPGVIELRHRRAAYCGACFVQRCREQVANTIRKHRMIRPGERVLVAISGGKDSLAVWDLLLDLGYDADGVYLGLGIGGYSDRSGASARAFADGREARLLEIDMARDVGFTIPEAAPARRAPCSSCGLSNRHLMYKELLNSLEERAPGSKATFLSKFSERVSPLLDDLAAEERATVGTCSRCGSPTTGDVCAFCRLRDQAGRPPGRRRSGRRGRHPARRGQGREGAD